MKMKTKEKDIRVQMNFLEELVIDNFAGGGGASTGMELALGRPVDDAINHDPEAIRLHKANHPYTKHHCENVWDVDPREICCGRKVALCWFSPDCKHFSKAKGGKPKDKTIRGLAWVAVRWAATVRPRVLILENVEEFQTWGPLDEYGHPIKSKRGKTFRSFTNALRKQGYEVEWKELRACDYGAPTIRKRFFLIARCDERTICWPEPTHGPGKAPYRTAAEIIDWGIPVKSIFERRKPLAKNTQRRIALGVDKYVLKDAEPFIMGRGLSPYIMCNNQNNVGKKASDPLPTVTTGNRIFLTAPLLLQYHSETGNGVRSKRVDGPMMTIDTNPRYALNVAFLSPYYDGGYRQNGRTLSKPLPTVTAIDHNSLGVAGLHVLDKKYIKEGCDAEPEEIWQSPVQKPLLTEYYSSGKPLYAGRPMHTITTIDCAAVIRTRIAKISGEMDLFHWNEVRQLLNGYCGYTLEDDELLVVDVGGAWYYIADIGLRMLTPRELYNAQGFPSDYIIDITKEDGRHYSKAQQIAKCGNSVPPPFAEALVRANLAEMCGRKYETMEDLENDIAM